MTRIVVLSGGPRDGKQIAVGANTNTIAAVTAEPPPWRYHAPRPPWWRHPIAWLRWKPPPPPELPRMIQLEYRADGTTRDGLPVFRLQDGAWRSYRGPDIDPAQDIYPAMVTALYAAPGDCVLGVLITVTEDGGAPHIENPRLSASAGIGAGSDLDANRPHVS